MKELGIAPCTDFNNIYLDYFLKAAAPGWGREGRSGEEGGWGEGEREGGEGEVGLGKEVRVRTEEGGSEGRRGMWGGREVQIRRGRMEGGAFEEVREGGAGYCWVLCLGRYTRLRLISPHAASSRLNCWLHRRNCRQFWGTFPRDGRLLLLQSIETAEGRRRRQRGEERGQIPQETTQSWIQKFGFLLE